jgi:hypothetical protein
MRRNTVLHQMERQHSRVRRIVAVVWTTDDVRRRDALSCLVAFLAFHLAAEEDLGGPGPVPIDTLVDDLRRADVESVEFILTLGQLEDALEDHASRTEAVMELAVTDDLPPDQVRTASAAARRLARVDDLANSAERRVPVCVGASEGIPFHELRGLARRCLSGTDRNLEDVADAATA